jgi:hypothetical protein
VSQEAGLVRSIVDRVSISCSMGLRDFDAVFQNGVRNEEGVRKIVRKVLTSNPFNLSVGAEGRAIVATRAFLPSSVFEGWREWISVRVSFASEGNSLGASIATNILVSKQNTTARDSWSPSSEQQQAAYLAALRREFERNGALLR